jgi:uncharacterized protein
MYYLLLYDYIDEVLERRPAFRAAHLELLGELHADGKVRMAGALSEPVDGAVIVCRERETAEWLAEHDPYVLNGLVKAHRIREWNVVIGD